jgi:hypothetical protein
LIACFSELRVACNSRRLISIRSLFFTFHADRFLREQFRQVPVMPPRHCLLSVKNSAVAVNSTPHFLQFFMSMKGIYRPLIFERNKFWGNETTKFEAAA